MRLLNTLERKCPWLAIPHLLSVIVAFQVLVFLLLHLQHPMDATAFYLKLELDGQKILQGEVWRLVSFLILPPSLGVIGMLFATTMLMFTGSVLEREWGSFRVTIWYFLTALLLGLAVVLQAWWQSRASTGVASLEAFLAASSSGPFPEGSRIMTALLSMLLGLKAPQLIIRLFFIIPVPAGVLGWISAGFLLLLFATNSETRLPIFCGALPFLCLFATEVYHWYFLKNRVWRARAARGKETPPAEYFSKCAQCQRTDVSNPELTFRVAKNDEEYCLEHFPKD